MTIDTASPRNELLDLLAVQATEGLSGEDHRRSLDLLGEHSDLSEDHFEFSAALAQLAIGEYEAQAAQQDVPDSLSQSLLSLAAEHEGSSSSTSRLSEGSADSNVVSLDQRRPRAQWFSQAGWWAAAACLALAVAGWWQPPATPPPVDGTTVVTVVDKVPLTIDSVLQAPGTLIIPWTATEDPTAVAASGDVVWNNELQKGFMRFRGLTKNVSTDFQYQLWIFDGTRDERYPVDGGVFDVFSEDLAVVPIEAKLPVDSPALFAITVEEPGGVVVSSRERITLVASVQST
ncbi:MAG: anti-sigma factor [Acidobacteriota bacterium]